MPKKLNTNQSTECTEKCQSTQHANELISAITLPISCIRDNQLASYFKSRCSNFAKVRDNYGRTLLHAAASCGRKDLCLFLLKTHSQMINWTDLESGYTALHRSIDYGFINVTVALLQMCADLNAKDYEDYCPLDIVLKSLDLTPLEQILYSKFPKSSQSKEKASKTSIKPIKKLKTDYGDLISFSNDKLETLRLGCYAFATEVYVWGRNSNYTSGFGSESAKSQPEFLEFFERKNEIIVDIIMQKFHTLFVSLSGNVWSCGIGQGGRLGLSSENIVLIPELVTLKSHSTTHDLFCIAAAAGQDHSIFLCHENKVFACGTNTYHQLGINPNSASVIKPMLVNVDHGGEQIIGVAASDFHSVLWTDSCVYTCGLHAGQLGHPNSEERTIPIFRKVPFLHHLSGMISTVITCRAATLVSDDSYIYVLTNYSYFKIDLVFILRSIDDKEMERKYRKNHDFGTNMMESLVDQNHDRRILKLAAFGGELNSEKIKSLSIPPSTEALQIAVVLHDGSLYLWQKKTDRLLRCHFLIKHDILVTNVVLHSNGMLITTKSGAVLKAKPLKVIDFSLYPNDDFKHTQNYASFLKTMRYCYILQVEKIESVFRAISVFSDPKGDNFAILQYRSAEALMQAPVKSENSLRIDLVEFHREADVEDSFHDVIFKVGRKSFAAHKYILASCSEKFLQLEENDGVIVIENMLPEVFEMILEFVYTGSFHIPSGSCQNTRFENRNSFSKSSPNHDILLKKLIHAAEVFKIDKLKHFLEDLKAGCSTTRLDVISCPNFDRLKFPSLHDIKLRSQDGAIFKAHKCILVARVDYFKSMLSGNWIESKNVDQEFSMPFTSALLSEVLEYIYTDTVSKRSKKKDLHFWTSLVMMADQFMLAKLKELSENAILEHLNVRNVVDCLLFAKLVNANQLKIACFRFICINLSSILYFRSLDRLDDELLHQLTEFYRNQRRDSCTQKFPTIPVYSDVCDVDEIFVAEQLYSVDWDLILDLNHKIDELVIGVEETKQKKKLKKTRKSAMTEINSGVLNQSKSNLHEKVTPTPVRTQESPMKGIAQNSIMDSKCTQKEEEWVAIRRQMKSIKSLLRVNAAAKECPQLIEQKENFVPLNPKNSPPETDIFSESESSIRARRSNPNDCNYSIDIALTKLSPKLSQAERKRLRRHSESSKTKVDIPASENDNEKYNVSPSTSPSLNCWKNVEQSLKDSTSFSSIMASEKKQKRSVMKETRKIETKSLHSTQIEEQAIQELMMFYNVKNVDDEHITVQRVIHEFNTPSWITK